MKGKLGESQLIATAMRLFFIGVSVSLGAQMSFVPRGHLALTNQIPLETRSWLISLSLVVGLIASLSGAVYVARSRTPERLERLSRLTRLGSPLLLSFFLPNLFNWAVYKDQPFLFSVLATLFGLALERSFRTSLRAAREMRLFRPSILRASEASAVERALPGVLLTLAVVGFAAFAIVFTIRQHYQVKTYSWDLGIFNNMMYNLIRGEWFKASPVLGPSGSHIQFHATFGAYLLAPLYALWRTPEMLLAIQGILVAGAAVPLYLIAKSRLESGWVALVFVYLYVIHAPVHGPLFYDFHFLTITPFFVLWVVYWFERGRVIWLLLAWLVAVSMREEVSATLALAALYYVLVGRRARWALLGGALSTLYFLVVKFKVMPSYAGAQQSFAWIFSGLISAGDEGFAGVLRTVATNPVFTFKSIFQEEKFAYLLANVGPVLLLPFRRSPVWVLLLPAALFTLLSTGWAPLVDPAFQYTANWTPYVLCGTIFCLDAWKRSPATEVRYLAALPALCLTATLFSYNFGPVFQRNDFTGGFNKVDFNWTPQYQRQLDALEEMIALIPKDASVSACELLVPHVSSRENAYTLNRVGALNADYLLCNVGWLKLEPVNQLMHQALDTNQYRFLAKNTMFALYVRKPGPDEQGRRLLGRRPTGSRPRPEQMIPLGPPPKASSSASVSPAPPNRASRGRSLPVPNSSSVIPSAPRRQQ